MPHQSYDLMGSYLYALVHYFYVLPMLGVRSMFEFIVIGAYLLLYGVLLSPAFICKGFLQLILSSIDAYFGSINLVIRLATCSLTTAGIHAAYLADIKLDLIK